MAASSWSRPVLQRVCGDKWNLKDQMGDILLRHRCTLHNLEEEKISSQGGLQAPRACSTQAEMFGSDLVQRIFLVHSTKDIVQEIFLVHRRFGIRGKILYCHLQIDEKNLFSGLHPYFLGNLNQIAKNKRKSIENDSFKIYIYTILFIQLCLQY